MFPPKITSLTSLATGVVLSIPVLSFGQTSTWTTTTVGPHAWDTVGNWSTATVPGSTPAGDEAIFDEPIAGGNNTINLATNITVDQIAWNDDDGNGVGALSNGASTVTVMTLGGAAKIDAGVAGGPPALDLSGDAFLGAPDPGVGATTTYRVVINNDIEFLAPTSINVGQDNITGGGKNRGVLQLTGLLTGSDDISKTGTGILDFEGTTDNLWDGKFTVVAGNARLNMPDGVAAFSSPELRLVGGTLNNSISGAGQSSEQILDTAVISFANDGARAIWNLNGNTETIANWGGGNGGGNADRLDLGAGNKATSIVNFGADNGDSSFAGEIRRDGNINKSGTGTWTLTGTDAIGSDIDINILDGTFQMNAVHDDNVGTYTIDGDMTGTGVIEDGSVIINSGGTLNAGTQTGASNLTDCLHDINQPAIGVVANQFETLEIKNLTLQTGSVTTFDINTSADIDAATAAVTANIAATVAAIGAAPFPQLDADDEYDQIVSDMGTLTLNPGGTIVVNPVNFIPARGMVYDLFSGFSSIVDNGFDAGPTYRSGSQSALFDLKLPELTSFTPSAGLRWDTSLFLSHGTLVIVPEPSRAVLLLGGFIMVLARRRR